MCIHFFNKTLVNGAPIFNVSTVLACKFESAFTNANIYYVFILVQTPYQSYLLNLNPNPKDT